MDYLTDFKPLKNSETQKVVISIFNESYLEDVSSQTKG